MIDGALNSKSIMSFTGSDVSVNSRDVDLDDVSTIFDVFCLGQGFPTLFLIAYALTFNFLV